MMDLFICYVLTCFDSSAARCALKFDPEAYSITSCLRRTHDHVDCIHCVNVDFIDLTAEAQDSPLLRSLLKTERDIKYEKRKKFQSLVRGPTGLQRHIFKRMLTFLLTNN